MATKKVAPKVTSKKTNKNTGKIVAGVIGIAALSAAAFLLMGPDGKKNRKVARAWMMKMKAEVAEKIEGMKEVTADGYKNVVDTVANKYSKMKNITPVELEAEVVSLKKEWSKMVNGGKKKVKKVIKKATK